MRESIFVDVDGDSSTELLSYLVMSLRCRGRAVEVVQRWIGFFWQLVNVSVNAGGRCPQRAFPRCKWE